MSLNNPDYFYKYFPRGRSSFFHDCAVRFSPIESLNDPFEQLAADHETKEKFSPDERAALHATISNTWTHSDSLACQALRKLSKVHKSKAPSMRIEDYPEKGGIFCMSETADNLLMWSHYGDQHRGFAIEIDANYFFNNEIPSNKNGFIIHRMRYRDSRIEDQPGDWDQYLNRIPYDILATKSTHWSYEQEWRIEKILKSPDFFHIANSDKSIKLDDYGNPIFLHKIPKKHITKVIFGANIMPSEIINIKNIIQSDKEFENISMKLSITDPVDFRVRLINITNEDLTRFEEEMNAA